MNPLWRRRLTALILAPMLVWLFGGFYLFPDAPFKACVARGYCGKQGQPHTEKEFRQFMIWETTLKWGWPIGLAALLVLNRNTIRRRGLKS